MNFKKALWVDWIEGFFGQVVEDWQNKSSQGYADDHIKDGVLIGGNKEIDDAVSEMEDG